MQAKWDIAQHFHTLNKTVTGKEIISKPAKVILLQGGRMESNLAKWSDFLLPLLYKQYKQIMSSSAATDVCVVQIWGGP